MVGVASVDYTDEALCDLVHNARTPLGRVGCTWRAAHVAPNVCMALRRHMHTLCGPELVI